MCSLEDVFRVIRQYCSQIGDQAIHLKLKLLSGETISHPIPKAPERPARPQVSHSPDFRSVHWHGEDFTFTEKQAAVVRALWEAWEDGSPEIGCNTLLQLAGSESERLRDVFQNNPNWTSLIVPGARRGTYRLREP